MMSYSYNGLCLQVWQLFLKPSIKKLRRVRIINKKLFKA